MRVDQAIRSRSSVKKFLDRTVSQELIEQCLSLAVWAPNHRLTEPWRFCVLTGQGRERFADAVSGHTTSIPERTPLPIGASGTLDEASPAGAGDASGDVGRGLQSAPSRFAAAVKATLAGEQIRRKIMSAPTVIVVFSLRGRDETTTRENFAATAAAVQNLLLGAHQLGLSTIWRTADYYSGQAARSFLQIPDESDFVAAIYVGYSDQRETPRKRTPAAQCTTWFRE